jgi:hypothetical protein
MVFWWTGRGYLALLSTIGVVGVFGAIATFAFGDVVFERHPWLWGPAYILAAGATWGLGGRINHRPLRLTRSTILKSRLFYRAPNRFCGLPVETWAAPLLALGVVLIVLGVASRWTGGPFPG